MNDSATLEFYRDPANQAPAGPAQRRRAPRKTSMISVRFDPEFIDSLRAIAGTEGITVSTWIRQAAQQARERAASEHRPQGLVSGSERRGELRALPSSLRLSTSLTGSPATWARCPHLSIGNIATAWCGICGDLSVHGAA